MRKRSNSQTPPAKPAPFAQTRSLISHNAGSCRLAERRRSDTFAVKRLRCIYVSAAITNEASSGGPEVQIQHEILFYRPPAARFRPRGYKKQVGSYRKASFEATQRGAVRPASRKSLLGRGIYLVSSPLKPIKSDQRREKSKSGRSGRLISSHLKLPKSDLPAEIACRVGLERSWQNPEAKIIRPIGRKKHVGSDRSVFGSTKKPNTTTCR